MTAVTLLSILSIILSTSFELKLNMVSLTRCENSLKLSLVIFLSMASLFNLIVTLLKKFSIGLRSGLHAGILKNFPSTLSIAYIAVFEF